MELKNYLVELLSNIIHDRLQELSSIKEDIKKSEDYVKVKEMLSDVNNIVNVNDDELRNLLSVITDEDTVSEILSNIDMIRIVVNGINDGLDLSLDDSQKELVKGVYEIIDNYCSDLDKKNTETKAYLEDFLSKCEELSQEIGTGVVRNIDVLDEIFRENDVSLKDIIKVKYEILRNNSKNYNMDLDGHVKEEVKLRLSLKKINIDFDSYNESERNVLINYCNVSNADELIDYISSNNLSIDNSLLLILLLFSNVSNFKSIVDVSNKYNFNFTEFYKIPGVFISNEMSDNLVNVSSNDNFEYLKYIGSYFELFNENITILEENNLSVGDIFNCNCLALIIPDISKNITILSSLDLPSEVFSVVVINPFLATSISSFEECGLKDYLSSNPLRLTTSYYRLRNIYSNIISARKNGKIIFRSLSDKKNYWLAKHITSDSSEVV